MKFTTTSVTTPKEILANDHYVAIPYDCSSLTPNGDGIIPAGTVIPANDATAVGVLLYDVNKAENPNGAIVIHGFVKKSKLPAAPASAAITALTALGINFVDDNGIPLTAKFAVTYDLNGATGTAVTDASSPYAYGTNVTVKTAPTVTVYPGDNDAFDKWNTKADGTGKDYAASSTFAITGNTKLYAIYKKA
jgi:hypothetical protein